MSVITVSKHYTRLYFKRCDNGQYVAPVAYSDIAIVITKINAHRWLVEQSHGVFYTEIIENNFRSGRTLCVMDTLTAAKDEAERRVNRANGHI